MTCALSQGVVFCQLTPLGASALLACLMASGYGLARIYDALMAALSEV